ncbi:MAG TPA: NYN domain-containing protein [Nitrospiria bacterium]|nr:NYN domain-containing protein [Nitrospiria bacterium]
MHMLIDGYNFIGRQKGLRGDLDAKRKKLLADLSRYHRLKGYPVTVVFDGWREGWEVEHKERVGGITVIYSRRGEQADAVIARLAREMGSACVVVTSDREVQNAALASGGTAIFSGEFEARLNAVLSGGELPGVGGKDEGEEDLTDRPLFGAKKGNPFRRSKKERKRIAKLKKL